MPQPSVGRIVHFVPENDDRAIDVPLAALITAVQRNPSHYDHSGACWEDCYNVDLCVFTRSNWYPMTRVPYGEQPEMGHWRWPARVE